MIGVTATGGAIIYYGHGDLMPLAGGAGGARRSARLLGWSALHAEGAGRWLKVMMARDTRVVAVLMFVRAGL